MKGLEPLHIKNILPPQDKAYTNFATTVKSGIEGFEPSNVDIKNQSLTFWLYPKNLELVSFELTTLRLSGTCSKPLSYSSIKIKENFL